MGMHAGPLLSNPCFPSLVPDMRQSLPEEPRDMGVVERVENVPSRLPHSHQAHVTHRPKLVRDSRLRHAKGRRNGVHALLPFEQKRNNPDAGRVAERLKDPREACRSGGIQERRRERRVMAVSTDDSLYR